MGKFCSCSLASKAGGRGLLPGCAPCSSRHKRTQIRGCRACAEASGSGTAAFQLLGVPAFPPCPGRRFGAPREPVLPPRATGLGGRRGSRQGLAYKRHLLCLVLGWPYSFGYRAAGGCTAPAGERLAEGTRKDSRGVGWGGGGAQRVPGTLGCWARCVRPSGAARALSGEFSFSFGSLWSQFPPCF